MADMKQRLLIQSVCLAVGWLTAAGPISAQGQGQLTGDWFGVRPGLADLGITFDGDIAQFYPGVTAGGLEQPFQYGGHGDYVVNFQLGKLGLNEGLFLKVRAEHRFGETINSDTGAFLPATVLPDLPVRDSTDLYLTDVLFTQALSEHFALFAGKLDTFDGDANAFASGRGKTQFMNSALVITPVGLRTIAYSTLGCGLVVLGEGAEPLFNFTLINPTDTAETDGFSELFAEGVAMSAELRVPTSFFDRPGHQLIGVTWSSRDFVALGQNPAVVLPNVPVTRDSDSWSLYWNCDQYLVTRPEDPTQGWGYFARAGIADEESNPIDGFFSIGLGGSALLDCRPHDTFGAGYYYSHSSDRIGPIIETLFGPIGAGQGMELFYNAAVTPWLHVSPDFQVLVPARENLDPAVVVGLRAVMTL
jgi:porin